MYQQPLLVYESFTLSENSEAFALEILENIKTGFL